MFWFRGPLGHRSENLFHPIASFPGGPVRPRFHSSLGPSEMRLAHVALPLEVLFSISRPDRADHSPLSQGLAAVRAKPRSRRVNTQPQQQPGSRSPGGGNHRT
eukprot:6730348-Pyramimonas_sp.AAC.1